MDSLATFGYDPKCPWSDDRQDSLKDAVKHLGLMQVFNNLKDAKESAQTIRDDMAWMMRRHNIVPIGEFYVPVPIPLPLNVARCA